MDASSPRTPPTRPFVIAAIAMGLLALVVALLVEPSIARIINPVTPAGPITWEPSGDVACTLEPVTGTLDGRDGRTLLVGAVWQAAGQPLGDAVVRWPTGWHVDTVFGGLQVFDAHGRLEAHSGDVVHVYVAQSDAYYPVLAEGALLACPFNDQIGGGWPPSP